MNNKTKTIFITFLITLLSFLSFNANVKAAVEFKGMYPIRSSYQNLTFYAGKNKNGQEITENLKYIGLYYQQAGSNYTQLFCLEPGVQLNPYTLSSSTFTKLDDYTGINSNYVIESFKKDLLKKIISVTPELKSSEISKVASLIGNSNIASKTPVVISDSSLINKLEDAFATQAIIWEIVGGERTSFSNYKPDNAKTGKNSSGRYNSFYAMVSAESGLSNLKTKYERLIDLVKATYLNDNLGTGDCVFTRASTYNKCKLNDKGGGIYSITITDPNFKYFEVALEDTDLTATISGDKLTVESYGTISQSNLKTITLNVKPINTPTWDSSNANHNPIQVFENASNQDLANIRSIWQTYNLSFYTDNTTVDDGTYHLRIKKVGGKTVATTPLAGATFKIYKCPDSWLNLGQLTCGQFSSRTPVSNNEYDMVSQSDGYARYETLPSAGKYAVVEVSAPDGYKKSGVTNYINVTKKSTDSEYDEDLFGNQFENYEETATPEYTITIKKVAAKTGEPLAGATFEIRKRLSLSIQTVTTNSNGEASVTLTPGEYTFVETMPPEGYVVSEKSGYSCPIYYSVKSDSCPDTIIFENELAPEDPKAYQLKFVKQGKTDEDSSSYYALEGVKFDLYKSDKKTRVSECNIITDEDGTGECTSIPEVGTYYLKEKETPEGYRENDEFYKVVVTSENISGTSSWAIPEGDKEGIIYNIVKPQEVVYYMAGISKYDALNNQKIVGATFNLLDDKYKAIDKCKNLVTNTNGIATCSSLTETGTYYFQEISAATGYVTDKNYIPIEVGQSDTVTTGGAKVSFANEPTTGKLIKYTIDENNNRVKLEDGCGTSNYTGPIFEIKDSTGKLLHFSKYQDGVYILSTSNSDSTEIKTCNGEFNVRKLPKGTYVVSEKQPPIGRYYEAPDQEMTITDSSDSAAVTFVNISVPDDDPEVSIINFKKKNEDGQILENGIFVLQKKVNGKYVDVKLDKKGSTYAYTTDANISNYQMENGNGEYIITNVPIGEYRIVERQAPEGYELISDANSNAVITVNESGKQYYVEMVDKKTNVDGSSSSAELIITISTGRKVLNYVLIISGLGLLLGCLILIRKKMKK